MTSALTPAPTRGSLSKLARLLKLSLLLLGVNACQLDTGTGKSALSVVGQGVVNNPGNLSLRYDIIRYGLGEFCEQLLEVGTPIRLADDQPTIGRFYASECQTKAIEEPGRSTILAQFAGEGFAYSSLTGRLGFAARGLLELKPDFRLHQDSLYVYFRPVQVDTSDFQLLLAENRLAREAVSSLGISEVEVGKAIIMAQLGRGFTVVRYDADGHSDFALGLVAVGEQPFRPFSVLSSPRRTLANGRTEIMAGQQDILGKLHVGKGEALTLTLKLEGAEAADLAILTEAQGKAVLEAVVRQAGAVKLKSPANYEAVLKDQAPLKSSLTLPEGEYYLWLDHSDAWGKSQPDSSKSPVRIDYLLQVGPALTSSGPPER